MNFPSFLQTTPVQEIAIGVAIGLILFLLEKVFSNVVVPWYRGFSENLPNLNGTTWQGFSDNEEYGSEPISTLKIRQWGNRIKAEVIRNVREGQRSFKYEGEMSAGQIILKFHDIAGQGYIIGAMVLHLESDLKTLTSMSVYYHHSKGQIVSNSGKYKKIT